MNIPCFLDSFYSCYLFELYIYFCIYLVIIHMNLCGIALLQNIRSYLRYITKFKVGTPFIPISFHYWSPPPLIIYQNIWEQIGTFFSFNFLLFIVFLSKFTYFEKENCILMRPVFEIKNIKNSKCFSDHNRLLFNWRELLFTWFMNTLEWKCTHIIC